MQRKKYRKALYFTKKKAREMGLNRLAELENNDTKTFWFTINKILRPPDNSMASIEPVQGLRHFRSLIQNHTPDGTNNQFSDYICASLSTLEGISVANEELNKPISLEELTGVIKDLKSGKASFLDNISNDVIKCGRLSLSQPIMHLFNTTLKEGGIPNGWSDGLIIPIHKKGDRLNANNYRGIIISSCMGKIFIKMLSRQTDQHMRVENSGI